jgi:hypothetical protein
LATLLLSLFLFGLGIEVLAVLFVIGWVLRRRLRRKGQLQAGKARLGGIFSPVDDEE